MEQSWWIFIPWFCLIAFWTHLQLCPRNFKLEGIVKKHLFPFPAESVGVKHKGGSRQGAFKPIEQTQVHRTRWEAPKGARAGLVSLWGPPLLSLRDHGSWGRFLTTAKSVLGDIQNSGVWAGWSAEILSYGCDSVVLCAGTEVCKWASVSISKHFIVYVWVKNSTGRQNWIV